MVTKINITDYKYIMFVDASGDDGYSFKETSSDGSSYSFVVSCFVCKSDDISKNKAVLDKMKAAMFVKPEQEIKSTALKRSRWADKVYKEMENLEGFAFSYIIDKRLIQSYKPKSHEFYTELSVMAQKDLSGLTHSLPYFALREANIAQDDERVLIVIDNMKKREKESIQNIISGTFKDQYKLIFRDSKDKDFSLIQIADVMAGTVKSYYENKCLVIKEHNRLCNMCVCIAAKSHKKLYTHPMVKRCLIKANRKLYGPYTSDKRFNVVMAYHSSTPSAAYIHFLILPFERYAYFMYITCMILKQGFLHN